MVFMTPRCFVFVGMAYKLVGELSPFNVYWLVTRNSTITLEDTGTFFCPQFPARIFEGQLHSDQCLFYPLVSCIIYLLCGQWTRPLFSVTSLEEGVVNKSQSPCSHAESSPECTSVLKCVPLIRFLFFRVQHLLFFWFVLFRLHSAFSPTLGVWAILLCLTATLALQTTVPSGSYQLIHRGFLSLTGSYLLDNVSKRFPSPV